MKDFDKERHESHLERERELGERTFLLCGEQFTYRPYVSYTVLEKLVGQSDLEGVELIRAVESVILDILEPGQEKRFLKVARNTEDPLTFTDLNTLATWLTEVQVNRPTQVLQPSTPGDGNSATSSTDASSTEPAVASAA